MPGQTVNLVFKNTEWFCFQILQGDKFHKTQTYSQRKHPRVHFLTTNKDQRD